MLNGVLRYCEVFGVENRYSSMLNVLTLEAHCPKSGGTANTELMAGMTFYSETGQQLFQANWYGKKPTI